MDKMGGKRYDIQKTKRKMAEVRSPLLVITLNVNGLSSPIRRQILGID